MNTVSSYREKTDVFFENTLQLCDFDGIVAKMYRYVTDEQLKDRALWARFVNQFRLGDDSEKNGWRGEFWGKMMRGAAFVYSYTRDPELYDILKETVEDMLTTPDQNGRISSYAYEKEFCGWDMWCKKYVLLGLQYFLEISDDEALNARIISAMRGCLDHVMEHVGSDKIEICSISNNAWRGLNSSSVLEPVVRLYMITDEEKYLDFARYIVESGGTDIANFVDIALEDTTNPYQYPVTKAYEMLSFFEGVLEFYRATREEKYKTAVVNFARRVMSSEVTIVGGIGCTEELFDHGAVRQADTPQHELMQETCVTVTWMKFCSQLLMATGDMRFANMYERAFYNVYLGAFNFNKNIQDTLDYPLPFDSYSPLRADRRGKAIGGRMVMRDDFVYGCCVAIGAAGIGLFHKIAVMRSRFGIAINMYANGTVHTHTPKGNDVTFDIKTAYPVGERVDIVIKELDCESFELRLRIPQWSDKTTLIINGEELPVHPYEVLINRPWKKGDTVSLVFDMTPKLHSPVSNPTDYIMTGVSHKKRYIVGHVVNEAKDTPFHVAITRGPLTLARDERIDPDLETPIDLVLDPFDRIDYEQTESAGFETLCEYQAKLRNGKIISLIDYAHAGGDWTKRCAVWLKTKYKNL